MTRTQLAWSVLLVGCILCTTRNVLAQHYKLDTLARSPVVALPVAIAFAPGGEVKFFFTEKNTGNIRIVEKGRIRFAPFATMRVTSVGEQGLHGVAVHPSYPDSPFVYVQFTRSGDRANVVMRLRDSSGYGVDPRLVVLAQRVKASTANNGGSLRFGPDGMLYCSFGDHGTPLNAQDSTASNILGKILRLNPNGSVPRDNPFGPKAFWSLGHRNSAHFAFDPLTGKMYCTEGGANCNNEVNYVPPRANLGWPKDGNCNYTDDPALMQPVVHMPDNPAFAGIAVYRAHAFPRLNGSLLFAGNNPGKIWSARLNAAGDSLVPGTLSEFVSADPGFSHIEVGPDGNVYATGGPASPGVLLRVRPVAPTFVSAPPLEVVQDSLFSYTPVFEGTPPTLSIAFSPDGMFLDSTTWSIHWKPTNAHALQQLHAVVLRAENGAGSTEQQFTINVINANDPPGPFSLSSPSHDTTLTFNGGGAPSVVFTWTSSTDPDLDTVRYVVEIDTVGTFDSPALLDTSAGTDHTLTFQLPRVTRNYFWRVRATDGDTSTVSSETWRVGVTVPVAVQEPKTSREEAEEEEAAILEQNFPNPFNPTTNIQYTIPKGGYVRLAVFNLLGQEVARIFEGVQSAGTYELTFNKEQLPTGIYFYRIQAPGFIETRKMVITK